MESVVLSSFPYIPAKSGLVKHFVHFIYAQFYIGYVWHLYGCLKRSFLVRRNFRWQGLTPITEHRSSQCTYACRRHLIMDYIFDCFFEQTFQQLTRSGLQDRQSRRDVLDHLHSIIKGCSKGQNTRTEEVACIAVQSVIAYHRAKKTANSEVCLMGKYHNILYIALRTCWDWGVRDSAVVVELLVEIYTCEKTFERIFLGALFGPNAPHFIAGWRSDFRDQDENIRALIYFLKHATSENLKLSVLQPHCEQERMVRFIDVPIESCGRASPLRIALQACAPDLLLILLRYGAEPNPPDGGASVIVALLDKLTENGRNYIYEHVLCLQIILRNVPMIEMPYKPIVYSARRELFFERYGCLLVDKIISKEQVFGVSTLRQLCRCRIRDALRFNNQLPNGIETLRLPNRLKRYIDLMEELDADAQVAKAVEVEQAAAQAQQKQETRILRAAMQRLNTIDSESSSQSSSESHELEDQATE